jgi:hypothetical protein
LVGSRRDGSGVVVFGSSHDLFDLEARSEGRRKREEIREVSKIDKKSEIGNKNHTKLSSRETTIKTI